MDFLKNIAKNVYSGVNKAASYVGNALSQGANNLAGLAASTYLGGVNKPTLTGTQTTTAPLNVNQALSSGGLNSVQQPAAPKTVSQQMSSLPSQYYDSSGNVQYGSTEGLSYQTATGGNASNSYTFTPYEIGNYRSALPALTGNQQDTRVSSKQSGLQYIDEKGRLITPKTGFEGLAGEGGGGLSYSSQAQGGIPGLTGSGGSAFTGLLGGVSGLNTPSSVTAEIDPKTGKKKTTISMQPGQTGTSTAPALPGVNQNIAPVEPSAQLNVKVPGTIDLGQLGSAQSGAGDAMIDIGTNDFQSFKENFTKAYSTALEQINAQNPTPENPVLETPEQSAFVEQSEDPFGYRQAMDDFRNSNTDLVNLQKQQIDVLKQIQAANQTFTNIVSDTKNNPDLPKGLAMRRINEIQSTQKTQIDQLLGQADILNTQISNQNEVVNRNFGIATQAQSNNEKEQERNLAKFKLFVDSGAIGAFTDADIKKYAGITGLSTSVIQKMKDSAKNPDLDIYTTTDDSGTVRGIDKNTGKVVWTQSGAGGTKTTQPADIKEFQGQYATFANRLEQAIPILDSLAPAITNMNAATLQAYVTASDIAPILSNKLIPDNVKSYIQASRDLINAVLRKESGAVISPSEFATARGQYLPMPGDSAQILAQKKTSAMANLDNFKRAAGGAYVPSVASPVAGGQSVTSGGSVNYTATLDSILKGLTTK